jgi:hypothetical protein
MVFKSSAGPQYHRIFSTAEIYLIHSPAGLSELSSRVVRRSPLTLPGYQCLPK